MVMQNTSNDSLRPRPLNYLGTVAIVLVCFCLVIFNIIAFVSIPTIQWQDLGLLVPMTVWPVCIFLNVVCTGIYIRQRKLQKLLPKSTYAIRLTILSITLLSSGVVALASIVMLLPSYLSSLQ